MWRMTYSPAPESGIRSTLQPSSRVYQQPDSDSEDDYDSPDFSLPYYYSTRATTPIDFYYPTCSSTPPPKPAFSRLAIGSNHTTRLPCAESDLRGNATKLPLPRKPSIPVAFSPSPSKSPPASSRSSSHNPDPTDSASDSQGYVLDAKGHKKYPCPHCDKMFGRIHDRKRHMDESTSCRGSQTRQDGEGARMWVCEKCGDSFSRRDSLNRHLRNPDACKIHKRRLKATKRSSPS
ncbi:hypothetical protein AGABI1DRAFT_127586 [Agaricus bisporus var. burnettii JB137-S8]|uniref:C2H2-type domain-containing protein n=1 Tax=Agaricus bisporus var. burnettii (strain JB137-S8 / ATCC MYA-4627 / FGSC 10392) TaxID=597362 RepID=K5WWN4_AGABU|nr:uncharacterized protein AGABI1DRAFT_127586 [Agaricus bisporus var. burnettii JB137-S8]EKM79906.1 hypothetical protein AGABI1DRAFT_127586 [Agaricus bisporus var. burnettii JB137-S8]